MYQSTKTYGPELGLSCCFRQWRATSHCRLFHGYALSFTLTFEADTLDARNWVMDFGGLKPVKAWLQEQFDHKLIIAFDDPCRETLTEMFTETMSADVLALPAVGCEAFAEHVAGAVAPWLRAGMPETVGLKTLIPAFAIDFGQRVRLHSVECREHGANSAIFICPRV